MLWRGIIQAYQTIANRADFAKSSSGRARSYSRDSPDLDLILAWSLHGEVASAISKGVLELPRASRKEFATEQLSPDQQTREGCTLSAFVIGCVATFLRIPMLRFLSETLSGSHVPCSWRLRRILHFDSIPSSLHMAI